ncbi:MAG: WD40 repeat domain-containing protein [Candidatus Thorarchaeota archaeon]|nr:WD40 repeat domain-containing protein [Candidatus Thorarchaeota archaeon]
MKSASFMIVILLVLAFISAPITTTTATTTKNVVDDTQKHPESLPTLSEDELRPQWSRYVECLWCTSMVSGDGTTCVIADEDVVSLVDVASNTTLWTFNTSSWILSVSISHNGSIIAVGTVYSQMIYVFGRASNTTLWEYECAGYVTGVEISIDGSTVGAVDFLGGIYLFDHSSNETLWSFDTKAQMLTLALSINGSTIVAGGKNNTVFVFDRLSNSTLWTYTTDRWIMGTGVSDDGTRISAVSIEGLFAFDRSSNTSLWTYKLNGFDELAMSRDGSTIAACTSSTFDTLNLLLFDYSSNETLWTFNTTSQITKLSVSYDGSRIAAGGYGNITFVFDKTSNKSLSEFNSLGYVSSLSYSSDGQFLVMTSDEQFLSTSGVGESVLFNLAPPSINPPLTMLSHYNTTATVTISTQAFTNSIRLYMGILYYSNDNTTWSTISMTNQTDLSESAVNFEIVIGPFTEGEIFYYCMVNNTFGDSVESQLQAFVVDGTGPMIGAVVRSPYSPTSTDQVTVTAEIEDSLTNVTQANLTYSFDSEWITILPVQLNDTFFEWSIPAMENDSTVQFYLTAIDSVGNIATDDNDGLYYTYWVYDSGDETTTTTTPVTTTTTTSTTSGPTTTLTEPFPIEVILFVSGGVAILVIAGFLFRKRRR